MKQGTSTEYILESSVSDTGISIRRFPLVSDSATSPPSFEEGNRLVKAFLRIGSPERRKVVLKYVTDMARMDEVERAH